MHAHLLLVMEEEIVIRRVLRDVELPEVKRVTTGNIISGCLLLSGAITINTPFAAARRASNNNPSGHVVDGLHRLHCCRH